MTLHLAEATGLARKWTLLTIFAEVWSKAGHETPLGAPHHAATGCFASKDAMASAPEASFAKGLGAATALSQGLVATCRAMARRCHGGVAAGVSARLALAGRAGLLACEEEGRLDGRTCMQTYLIL